eukprot:13030805-Alexandrium_andersonii.AAC.1
MAAKRNVPHQLCTRIVDGGGGCKWLLAWAMASQPVAFHCVMLLIVAIAGSRPLARLVVSSSHALRR